MMNNKGQTLILFVIFIPLLLILAAFVIDIGYIMEANSKLENTTKLIIERTYKNNLNDNQIINLFKKNDINTDGLEINRESNQISIKIMYYKKSIFGNVIGIKKYKIKTNIKSKYENNKVIYLKE